MEPKGNVEGAAHPRNILVTGGAGFIGSHLVDALLEAGHAVRVLDDLSTGRAEQVDTRAELVVGCVTCPETCRRATRGIDVVVHLAARGSVPRSVEEPEGCFQVNAVGTLNVLQAALQEGSRRVVVASSSSIYGTQPGLPRHVSMKPEPRSPYAASKVAAESLAQAWHATWGLETVVLRFFNVYGPRQRPDTAYAAVVPRFLAAALDGIPAELHGDGAQSRDFTYVADAVTALHAAVTTPGLAATCIDVAAGQPTTVAELHEQVARLTGVRTPSVRRPMRPGDVRHSVGDPSQAASLLRWKPTVPLEEGIRRTLVWMRTERGLA